MAAVGGTGGPAADGACRGDLAPGDSIAASVLQHQAVPAVWVVQAVRTARPLTTPLASPLLCGGSLTGFCGQTGCLVGSSVGCSVEAVQRAVQQAVGLITTISAETEA